MAVHYNEKSLIEDMQEDLLPEYDEKTAQPTVGKADALPKDQPHEHVLSGNTTTTTQCTCGANKGQETWAEWIQGMAMKVAVPINKRATARGCESFVPMDMNLECEKAARILTRFSYFHDTPDANMTAAATPASPTGSDRPAAAHEPNHHVVRIPPSALADAIGVAIFSTGRLGLGRFSGSVGSGILVTRRPDNGQWGAPSAIQMHGVGGGLLAMGLDITDRVYLIYTREALGRFTRSRFVLGPEVVLAVGKYGGGGGVTFTSDGFGGGARRQRKKEMKRQLREQLRAGTFSAGEAEKAANEVAAFVKEEVMAKLQQKQKAKCKCGNREHHEGEGRHGSAIKESLRQPVYCYMHSHGLYAGLQAEGAVFSERADANTAFYGKEASVTEILHDTGILTASMETGPIHTLWDALHAAEAGHHAKGVSSTAVQG